jgi:hypothetical protein
MKKKPTSEFHPVDEEIEKVLHHKWYNQDPAERLRYKRVKNHNAEMDNIQRIQTEEELFDYCRRFRHRDAIFDVPLRKIMDMF